MAAFHRLELRTEHFDTAAEIGFSLRLRGVTVPVTDLIIAASALEADAEIYHVDAHFDQIAEHTELRAQHLDGDDE